MKATPILLLATLVLAGGAGAQERIKVPRGIGGSGSFTPPKINVTPGETKKPETVVTTMSYMCISPERQWRSADGKSILASLLTFNADGKTAEQLKTTKLEVIREGKVRLLTGSKPFVLPLERLSAEDQTFVTGIAESAAKRATGGEEKAETKTEAKTEE